MRYILVVIVLLFVCGPFAIAGQDDPRLDQLFSRLLTTEDPHEATQIQENIWELWMYSEKEDQNVLMKQGTFAMAARDFDLALESFNALIEIAPNLAEAWNKRATLFYLMQNYKASVADVKKTLALEARHFGAIVGMGLIYEALGDQEAALEAFHLGLKVNPHMSHIKKKSEQLARELKDKNI
jgi:tetratricopeptide (TPR) repeat protein